MQRKHKLIEQLVKELFKEQLETNQAADLLAKKLKAAKVSANKRLDAYTMLKIDLANLIKKVGEIEGPVSETPSEDGYGGDAEVPVGVLLNFINGAIEAIDEIMPTYEDIEIATADVLETLTQGKPVERLAVDALIEDYPRTLASMKLGDIPSLLITHFDTGVDEEANQQ